MYNLCAYAEAGKMVVGKSYLSLLYFNTTIVQSNICMVLSKR